MKKISYNFYKESRFSYNQYPLIEWIDDIIEEYIEIANPSAYFLAALSQIGEEG